jgi:hypothetical protein
MGRLRVSILAVLMAFAVAGSAYFVASPGKTEAAAAYNINVVGQTCTGDGYVRINLAWGAPMEGAQYVDLSLSNNGWAPGTFVGIGPFGAYDGSGVWAGLVPGALHFLRINTVNPFGWSPSQTISFVTRADCANFISYNPVMLPFRPSVFSQECLPDGRVRVFFNTGAAANPGFGQFTPSVMFADVSVLDARFIPGTFIGYGEIAPAIGSFWWDGLMPNRTHFFRLNGWGPGGWLPSQPLSFTTIAC